MNKVIKIYADGACRGNQNDSNIGGYGVIMIYGDYKKEFNYACKNTTNNRMELLAVIDALKNLKIYDIPVEIYSDSQYVIGTANYNWKRNANIDLWKQFDSEISKLKNVTFYKVKGHSDDVLNNRADELANIAMNQLN